MKDSIEALVKEYFKDKEVDHDLVTIEHPENLDHGDYSTNAALVYAKDLNIKPKDLATELKRYLEENKNEDIEKIEIAGPGFVNIYLSKKFFQNNLNEIIEKGSEFGKTVTLETEKIIIEYTDPNPFKEFHIGHLMSNSIGEAVSRIIEANGAEVKRACYQGDVGMHVAKTIWGANEMKLTVIKDIRDSAAAYTLGAKEFEANPDAKKEITEINKKIYQKDPEVQSLYDSGKGTSLEYFDRLYKILGTNFDFNFFESDSAQNGVDIVKKHIGEIFTESDGAVVFHAEKYDPTLHTRVFINSEGLPTYEAKELGLAKLKYDKYPYTKSIVVTGNEIKDYFRVLLAAMKFVFPDLRDKTKHLPHGMLRLPSGKMSSRTGDVITAESLIDDVKNMIGSKGMLEEMSEEEREDTKEKIAIGAIKYMILRQSIGNDIIFDFEKSLSLEGDSGPYLQYAYARTRSLLEKAGKKGDTSSGREKLHEIEKLLYRFPGIVERAMKEYAPNLILTYLVELSGSFNNFYAQEKIISEEKESPYRLAIAEAFGIVLKNGLTVLGIPVPNRM